MELVSLRVKQPSHEKGINIDPINITTHKDVNAIEARIYSNVYVQTMEI